LLAEELAGRSRTARPDKQMADRHFPPPWTVEDIGEAFVVKDSAGQKLAYVYFEDAGPAIRLPSC
jgi:hypothetical protein